MPASSFSPAPEQYSPSPGVASNRPRPHGSARLLLSCSQFCLPSAGACTTACVTALPWEDGNLSFIGWDFSAFAICSEPLLCGLLRRRFHLLYVSSSWRLCSPLGLAPSSQRSGPGVKPETRASA